MCLGHVLQTGCWLAEHAGLRVAWVGVRLPCWPPAANIGIQSLPRPARRIGAMYYAYGGERSGLPRPDLLRSDAWEGGRCSERCAS